MTNVSSGQTDTNDVVVSGGSMFVLSGGIADTTSISSRSFPTVDFGGTASGTIVSGGGSEVIAGLDARRAIDIGADYIHAAGIASDTPLEGGVQVLAGGTAVNTTISSDGTQYDYDTATNTTISDGQHDVWGGGTASGTTVGSDGEQNVLTGGTATI